MKLPKIDWTKFGKAMLDVVQASSGTIVSGLGMLGLAILAKKLDIPYQVLLDPSYSMRTTKITQFPQAISSGLTIMPNNSVEAAIGAIFEDSRNSSDYYKREAAKKIYAMLSDGDGLPDDRTKSYAIMCLNSIARACGSSYYSSSIMDLIAKIGTGDF